MMYDLFMRLPLLLWALFCMLRETGEFVENETPIHIAMRLSTIAFMLLVAAVVVLRTRPREKARGWEPRMTAFAGSFMTYGFVLFPPRNLSVPLEMVSTVLILIGTVGAVVALSQLGRSFSIMAETRKLVTSGPYRFVRHPLYLTEEIAIVGMFMQYASAWTAVLMITQLLFQLRRMHHEETVLTAGFPEYLAYQESTARLVPGVY